MGMVKQTNNTLQVSNIPHVWHAEQIIKAVG